MRRPIALVAIALGTLLLLLAPLLRWFVYPQVAVVPHDTETTTVSFGEDIRILDIAAVLAGRTAVERVTDITSTRGTVSLVGELPESESNDDVAVWHTVVNNADARDETVSATESIVAFDRHTGAGVPGYNQAVNGEPVEHEGQILKFPFGTEKRDYEFWDANILATQPAVYDGEEEIDGLTVYRFVQTVQPTVVDLLDVPGQLAGVDQDAVEVERVYSNVRTLWVEPNTGVIIRGQEDQDSILRYEGEEIAKVTDGTLAYTDETVASLIDEYSGTASQLNLIRNVLPLVALIAGLVLLAAGILLLRERGPRRASGRHAETDSPDDSGGESDGASILDFERRERAG
ncbi:MAG TPA: DUF3068 domain-containing protein [Jiangellaceae bacterium]|nr:DUF3068 domain-containing protein [Jiangellaceae bacterium]